MNIEQIEKLKREPVATTATVILVKQIVDQLLDAGIFRSCLNCKDFIENTEQCRVYKQRPPARVIVTGCESHSDNIPF